MGMGNMLGVACWSLENSDTALMTFQYGSECGCIYFHISQCMCLLCQLTPLSQEVFSVQVLILYFGSAVPKTILFFIRRLTSFLFK